MKAFTGILFALELEALVACLIWIVWWLVSLAGGLWQAGAGQ